MCSGVWGVKGEGCEVRVVKGRSVRYVGCEG